MKLVSSKAKAHLLLILYTTQSACASQPQLRSRSSDRVFDEDCTAVIRQMREGTNSRSLMCETPNGMIYEITQVDDSFIAENFERGPFLSGETDITFSNGALINRSINAISNSMKDLILKKKENVPKNRKLALTTDNKSNNDLCPIQDFLGRTFYVPFNNYCWKIELFQGGVIAADTSDPDCTNESFTASLTVSKFNYGDASTAYFDSAGSGGFSGSIEFRKDENISSVTLKPETVGNGMFVLGLLFPSCNMGPSYPCFSSNLLGKILYAPVLNLCIEIEVFDGGFLAPDTSDSDCSNPVHNSQIDVGEFDYIHGNKIYYTKNGASGWSGYFEISEDSSLTGLQVVPKTIDPTSKEFIVSLTYPNCPVDEIEVQYVGNPCTDFFSDGKCTECTGDCDADSDCVGDLRCAKRRNLTGEEIVPGCVWGDNSDGIRLDESDYCFLAVSKPGFMNYVGECSAGSYLCGLCEGDCDDDSDCKGDLVCAERDGFAAVTGCQGAGGDRDLYGKDVCVSAQPSPTPPSPTPMFPNSLKIKDSGCSVNDSCSKCEGPCNNSNSVCDAGLVCFDRAGSEPVPGCVTGGAGDLSGADYCYEDPLNGDPTYIPGDMTKRESGLILSTGLTAKRIATTGRTVSYTDGGQSSINFHPAPDAGAVFVDTSVSNPGGWIYASNSEVSSGGVGAIKFNSDGQVINYEMILDGTSRNCGGGKTYWGTWVTCEENGSNGQVWETDPALNANSQRNQATVLGGSGGNYESFAYDARDRLNPTFYVTNDSSRGSLVRFTPNSAVVANAEATGDYSEVLYTPGTLKWLVLIPGSGGASASQGTFRWSSSRSEADSNSDQFYQNSEGIDVRNGFLYFVTKRSKSLYILDLDNLTYERSSTVSGAFDGQPDQVKRIIAGDPNSDMLYFCEEASADNGIHARDTEGNFYTIIDSDTLNSETTGLAFSPDNKHMYVSYQGDGIIFDISREDGYPFGAHRLDIKYHND